MGWEIRYVGFGQDLGSGRGMLKSFARKWVDITNAGLDTRWGDIAEI